MKKKNNKDLPQGKISIVDDFLPSPHELVMAERRVKITIDLDEETINFFKREADKHKTKYQRMIRKVLKTYAEKFKESA